MQFMQEVFSNTRKEVRVSVTELQNVKIKLKRKLDVTDLSGEKVMIDFESGKYFLLKGSANDIWNMIQDEEEITIQRIVQQLMKQYQVSESVCKDSVVAFIRNMEEYQFVSVQSL